MIIGLWLFGLLSDKLLNQKKGEKAAQPELRLLLMMWLFPVVPASIFWYGWTTYYKMHWIVPILGTGILGFGAVFIFTSSQVYMMDIFGPQRAASALAAIMVFRNLFGPFLALAATPLYKKLGLGWGNSFLGFVILAFAPVPFLLYRYGERLRMEFPVKLWIYKDIFGVRLKMKLYSIRSDTQLKFPCLDFDGRY
jgi:MFS family permease